MTGEEEAHTKPDAEGNWYILLCSVATG